MKTPNTEIDALEQNLWAQWSQFGLPGDCSFQWNDTLCQLDTPIASFPYNGVFKFNASSDADEHIDAIIRHFDERAVNHFWLAHPTASPGDLDRRLAARGLGEVDAFAGMVVEPDRLIANAADPDGVEIHEIKPTEANLVLEMVAKRWSVPTDAMPHLQAFFRAARIGEDDSPMRGWLATMNGLPIGKGFTYRSGAIVGLYGVATRPEARGKGIGSALCARALHDSCDHDVELLVLHSSKMARSLYAGFGFREVAPFRLFARAS